MTTRNRPREARRHDPTKAVRAATSLRFVQLPARVPPNGGTSESPHAKRAEKLNPELPAEPRVRGATATTRYGVSPSDGRHPWGRIEGFCPQPPASCHRAATLDTPIWGVRSSCPSNRTKQRSKTRLNISSTRDRPTARGSFHKNQFRDDQICRRNRSQLGPNSPLPSIAVLAQHATL